MKIEKIIVVFYSKPLYTNILSHLKKELIGVEKNEVIIVTSTRYAAKEEFAESLSGSLGITTESFGKLNTVGYKINPSKLTFNDIVLHITQDEDKKDVKNIVFLFEKGMTHFCEEICNTYSIAYTANVTFSPTMNKKLGKSILLNLQQKTLTFMI